MIPTEPTLITLVPSHVKYPFTGSQINKYSFFHWETLILSVLKVPAAAIVPLVKLSNRTYSALPSDSKATK